YLFAWFDRTRAGGASYAGIAAVVQSVIGHALRAAVGPALVVAPLREGVEIVQPVGRVEFRRCHVTAGEGLRAALSGDPCALAGKRPRQRLGLADCAAALAQLDAPIKRVEAVGADIPLQRPSIGMIDFDM